MHATGCPHSLSRPVSQCLPLGQVQKQVHFDLANDLGNAPSLPTDLASFLGEDVTDEQIDAPCPPSPLTVDPPQIPHDNGNQHCSTHMGGAHPKTSTAKPKADG